MGQDYPDAQCVPQTPAARATRIMELFKAARAEFDDLVRELTPRMERVLLSRAKEHPGPLSGNVPYSILNAVWYVVWEILYEGKLVFTASEPDPFVTYVKKVLDNLRKREIGSAAKCRTTSTADQDIELPDPRPSPSEDVDTDSATLRVELGKRNLPVMLTELSDVLALFCRLFPSLARAQVGQGRPTKHQAFANSIQALRASIAEVREPIGLMFDSMDFDSPANNSEGRDERSRTAAS